MTATRAKDAKARPAAGSAAQAKLAPVSAYRVGPVITMVAAVVGAVIMFGLGVLAGRVCASVFGLHAAARTAVMLSFGAFFGLGSAVSSARRHLPRNS